MYQQCRDNIVAQSNSSAAEDYNEDIADNGGTAVTIHEEITETLAAIDELIREVEDSIVTNTSALDIANSELEVVQNQIDAIHQEVAIQSFFTAEEYNELYDYIYEGIYQDE